MKSNNFKLWFGFLIAIVILAFMLFQQSTRNKLELEEQAIRNMQLVKSRLLGTYEAQVFEKLWKIRRDSMNWRSIKEMDSLTVNHVKFDWSKGGGIAKPEYQFTIRFSHGVDSSLNISKLFAPFMQQAFFEQLVLADTVGTILFPSGMVGQRLSLESLSPKQHSLLPIIKNTIVRNNQPYFVYTTPVDIAGTKFHLHGLISQDFFERIGRKVDFTNITVLVFVLSLMFFSLPLFSFFGLGLGDTLTRFGVYLVGLSLIGIMLVIGFGTAFFKAHHPVSDLEHESYLTLAKDSINRKLGEYTSLLNNWETKDLSKFNALLRIDTLGITRDFFNNGKEEKYPDRWRLDHREYYRYFTKNLGESPYYVGAHYSLVNSNRVVVVSTEQPSDKWVKVIGFEAIDWFKGNWIPASYLVFKENGLVLGSSERLKVIADSVSQLLPEHQWAEIMTIVKTNRTRGQGNKWQLSTYLDGHAMNATLVMLDTDIEFDQPIWLLYLVDEHLEHVFSSLVTYESAFFVILYIFILATLSLINRFVKPKSKRLDSRKFAYGYLFPKASKRTAFVWLICFLVANCAWMLYFFHLPSIHFVGMFLILVISTFQIKVLMYIWLDPEFNFGASAENEFISKTLWQFLGVMGSLILILVGYLLFHMNHLMVYAFVIWVVLSILASLRERRTYAGKSPGTDDEPDTAPAQASSFSDQVSLKPYPIFMVFWIFSIGFLPGYIIFLKVYQFEKQKWHIVESLGEKPELGNPNQILGNDTKTDRIELPAEFWNSYDEWRRFVFGGFTTVSAPEVFQFIAADRSGFQPVSTGEIWNGQFFAEKFDHIRKDIVDCFWLLVFFAGTIVLFFALVRQLAQRIYLLANIASNPTPKDDETHFSPISNMVFICGVDIKRNLDWIRQKFAFTGEYIYETNCLSNPKLEFAGEEIDNKEKVKIWLVNNVHSLPEQNIVLDRLPKIVEYCQQHNLKLIVTSGVSWKYLLRSFNNELKEVAYSELFSDFQLEYVPVMGSSYGNLEMIYKTESESAEYVRSRKPYYFNIWEEMSLEEKKVCYDFSLHDFYNHTNKAVIAELQQKGILVRKSGDELPKLFSVFFRQFIRNNVSDAEKSSFRNFEKRNGNAGNIQIAVFSFLLLSVALISYFDKNFLDQATTFVTGIVGALGGLYSLLSKGISNFGSGKKPSE